MTGELLILGVTLSLDNFRTAIVLGALRLTWRHAVQVALVFGFWDMAAPLVEASRTPAPEALDPRWALFGLPLPLSVDNVVAGTSLGLLGFSPWLAPPLFGAITALMTFVGLAIGRAAARLIRIRSDLLTGVALIIMAILLGLGLGE
jgi:putative Mn2+ efflux pump MntP